MMSGLDAPNRIPDLELITDDGPTWLSTLLYPGRALLLDFGARTWPTARSSRVNVVQVKPDGEHDALLIRPDGLLCASGEAAILRMMDSAE